MIRIKIHRLKILTRLGWTGEERSIPQSVLLDLTLGIDGAKSLKSDDLSDTLDYMRVVKLIETMSREKTWKLLETMSYDLAGEIFASFPIVNDLSIQITKNIIPDAQGLGAEFHVTREEYAAL